MAVTTTYKRQEQTANNTPAIQSKNPYKGMAGVSQSTANNLGNYQQGYQPSQNVTAAQQNLQNIQAQKPQGYNSKYAGALDNIMQQIQNPGEFKYEFNGDNLFKNYADLYTEKGRQAMVDTMGQAAALTGGYGNSYAQNVGQQAYQQNLLPLYDMGMQLRNAAYGQYQDKLGNDKDIYNMLQGADAQDYGRYRDTVADWMQQEGDAYNRMAAERNFDYGTYGDALNYYTQLAQIENAAYNTEADRQEAIREFNEKFAEQQRATDLDEAYRRDTFNWNQATDARDYAEDVRRTDRAYNEDVRRYDTNLAEDIRRNDRDFAEGVRQFDVNTGLKQQQMAQDADEFAANYGLSLQQLAEEIRQADMNNDYKNKSLAQDAEQFAANYGLSLKQLAENIRQADMDNQYRYANLDENARQADMDNQYNYAKLNETIRQADLDNQYNYEKLGETAREADLDNQYRYDNMNWNMATDARDYLEKVRQADLDEAYRRDTLGWNQATDQRDYDEKVREYNRGVAWQYIQAIMAQGQTPSDELLDMAGLSQSDYLKMLQQMQMTGAVGNIQIPNIVYVPEMPGGDTDDTTGSGTTIPTLSGAGIRETTSPVITNVSKGSNGKMHLTYDNVGGILLGGNNLSGMTGKTKTSTISDSQYNKMLNNMIQEQIEMNDANGRHIWR